ncbi:hypothetical protein HZS_5179 [Henneguya salminicola]|nr:hypothetical protein HZS_5179 [Henneguya salminicola]
MTPLDQCYIVNENNMLDFKTISEIVKSGYSRIPIYSNTRTNIVAMLHIKDLAFIDPDDMIPLVSVLNFYNHALIKVFHDTNLDIVFKEFKKGLAHLGIVIKIKYQEGLDPVYEAIGIVTLEDIIEEIIQAEISDETDIKSPYRDTSNLELSRNINKHHIRQFFDSSSSTIPEITPNMHLTICQFMSTALKIFIPDCVSLNILRRMVAHPGVAIKRDYVESYYLYKKGIAVDYFILLIEGRVEVTIGSENLKFFQGPFSYYGHSFLEKIDQISPRTSIEKTKQNFIPDFSLKILTSVVFLKISFSLYKIAVEATKLEKQRKHSGQKIDDVWDNVAKDVPTSSELPESQTSNNAEGPDIILIANNRPPDPSET